MELSVKGIFLLICMAAYTRGDEVLVETPAVSKSAPLLAPVRPQPLLPPAAAAAAASADYGFRYAVNDFKGNEHSHQQRRVGNSVTGQYKVLLPDGRLQTVTYIADENGYRAKVDYTPGRPGEATTAGLGVPPPPQQGPLRPGPFNVVPFAAQKNADADMAAVEETQGQSPLLRRGDAVTKEDILDVEQVDLPSAGDDASEADEDHERPTVKRGTRRLGSMAPIRLEAYPTYSSRAGRVRFNTDYTRGPRVVDPILSYRSPYTLARFAY